MQYIDNVVQIADTVLDNCPDQPADPPESSLFCLLPNPAPAQCLQI
jgi:hypothetical protein